MQDYLKEDLSQIHEVEDFSVPPPPPPTHILNIHVHAHTKQISR